MLDATQPKFTKEFNKLSHVNKINEAKGLIGFHVFDELFHIFECDPPKNVWDKIA